MATIKNLLSAMIDNINENTSEVDNLSKEIADLKAQFDGGGSYTNLADTTSSEWLTGYRLSTSSTSALANTDVTNYIPCKLNDTIRIKGLNLLTTNYSTLGHRFHVVNTSKTMVRSDCGYTSQLVTAGKMVVDGDVTTIQAGYAIDSNSGNAIAYDTTAYMRFCGTLIDGYTAEDVIITVNEEITSGSSGSSSSGSGETTSSEDDIPEYWKTELETKANDIQVAMEKAGRNKSAFLWYTDAHWVNGNSKVSPMLLDYLYMNTPMNKVNFGGDIIGDSLLATRDEMTYLYEWRKAIKDLPNHHSVFGNHDMFDLDSVDYENDNFRYAFLLAPEETPDMVWGDGNYYYIDNPAEKTRYLHLAYLTGNHTAMVAQGQFIVDAIKTVAEGWHIVAIAHRWWQYSSSSTPTTGSIPAYETEILKIFDEYNARGSHTASNYFTAQNFADAKGKVEFCIGGHIHVDYDIFTAGGIPIIVTTADTNQNRVPDSTVDSGTVGTITEAAVFGIIADYNEEVAKITVVGVGRGTSRVVRASTVTLQSIIDVSYSGDTTVGATIDNSKFSFTAYYSDGSSASVTGATTVSETTIEQVGDNLVTIYYTENGVTVSTTLIIVGTAKPVVNLFDKNDADIVDTGRFNSSLNAVAYQTGQLVTGYIEGKVGDTFTVESDKSNATNGYTGMIQMYTDTKTALGQISKTNAFWEWSADSLTGSITIPSASGDRDYSSTGYVRFCVAYTDIDSIVITKS